ncbi:MAG: YceI family protein [Bdellovibrionales bacterium]
MRKVLNFCVALAFCGFFAVAIKPAHAASYYVAPGQVSAEIRVAGAGEGRPDLLGQFGTATGSFDYDAASHVLSRLRVAIDGDSLSASNYGSQRELAAMLEADAFREISLASSGRVTLTDGKGEVKGLLTLHGVTKPVTAQVEVTGGSPDGGISSQRGGARMSLKVDVKRGDFGISDDPDEEKKFGSSLTLALEMQGVRQ